MALRNPPQSRRRCLLLWRTNLTICCGTAALPRHAAFWCKRQTHPLPKFKKSSKPIPNSPSSSTITPATASTATIAPTTNPAPPILPVNAPYPSSIPISSVLGRGGFTPPASPPNKIEMSSPQSMEPSMFPLLFTPSRMTLPPLPPLSSPDKSGTPPVPD